MKEVKEKEKNQETLTDRGITLLALVITIIIIIILATVAINLTLGDGGLIDQAEQVKDMGESSTNRETSLMSNLLEHLEAEYDEPVTPPEPTEPEDLPKVEEVKGGEAFTTKTTVEDAEGNKIVVPAGFRIASDSGNTVQQGIVIEDVSASTDTAVRGSQFVWIPVEVFIKDGGTPSNEIVLGRYTFANDANGTPTLQQAAYTSSNPENYKTSKVIATYYDEISTYREGSTSLGPYELNATAYNLEAWVDSVKENGGYYIGRYEASFASGTSYDNYKAATKVSDEIFINTSSPAPVMEYREGVLWNYILQPNASKVAINTYADSTSVKSDLMNSYAWGTAIVFIQECGYTNYANTIKTGEYLNTGESRDEVCKINDMAQNLNDLTTEYSNNNYNSTSSNNNPATYRNAGTRTYTVTGFPYSSYGFRLTLYMI